MTKYHIFNYMISLLLMVQYNKPIQYIINNITLPTFNVFNYPFLWVVLAPKSIIFKAS